MPGQMLLLADSSCWGKVGLHAAGNVLDERMNLYSMGRGSHQSADAAADDDVVAVVVDDVAAAVAAVSEHVFD
jgi:hypothetical protein